MKINFYSIFFYSKVTCWKSNKKGFRAFVIQRGHIERSTFENTNEKRRPCGREMRFLMSKEVI